MSAREAGLRVNPRQILRSDSHQVTGTRIPAAVRVSPRRQIPKSNSPSESAAYFVFTHSRSSSTMLEPPRACGRIHDTVAKIVFRVGS